ncbi:methylated-DNA--[protein]-cysteine S-methyltransferase [Streptomyces sp. NBC_01102]|uniref:methylated-DNA--[protein]-cysteine S-methyltransferase n=1 Tax=unclassified Streptomyces TaxID=2593676 RepID=UPI00386F3780|nr:methylated-DNA--[protein]-cysteine S-methyltransferase [Streptomyces sp. NBC_01102]
MNPGFALFDSAVGRCGIAWSDRGVTCVQLPEPDEEGTRARLALAAPDGVEGKPPPAVRVAVDALVRHFGGASADLGSIVLDLSAVPPFRRRVYEEARRIPAGTTLTYGLLAERVGQPGGARAVGQALARNPFALVVPCHRVVAAGGRPGGFSANGGVTTKLGLLAVERAAGTGGARPVDGHVFPFDPDTALAYLRGSDPGLGVLIDEVGPFAMRVNEAATVFGALAEAVVYQQLSNKAAATIFGRLRALFPETSEGLLPEQILSASEERLRSAGLSRAKAASLHDLAARVESGRLPELDAITGMADEDVVDCLAAVRGIGRWTAQMFLMFRLGRPDVLPLDDYGIRNGFSLAFGLRELAGRAEIEERGVLWRPYRTVACWYLWEAVERAKQGPSA